MIKKMIQYIINPRKILLYIFSKDILKFVPDEIYLKMKYKIILRKSLDLNNPRTFNEKMQWLKLNCKNQEYTKMVDKYEVKEYITSLIGGEYIIPTLGIYDSFDEINFDELPKKFVLKCTHDSGGLIICKDKNNLDLRKARKKINKSLKTNYYWSGREWPYKDVKHRIIIEKYMEDEKYKQLIDYKFMCFNGVCKYIFVFKNREKDLKLMVYDREWNRVLFGRHKEDLEENIDKPNNYNKMLEYSEKISKNIIFDRVDWYEINNKLYFGEITFYPASGFKEFEPNEWDKKLGDLIKLSKESKNEK